jgi:signal transduction histidine kinase
MWLRHVVAPLVSGATYRRAVFLVLGGLLLAPYVLLAVVFDRLWREPGAPRGALVPLAAVALCLAVAPPFLGVCRVLEISAARAFLDAEVPEPPAGERVEREARLRSAVWIGVHMAIGGVVVLCLISVFPMALVLVAAQFGIRVATAPGQPFGPLVAHRGTLPALISVLAVVALGYGIAGLGTLVRALAPALLGPSQLERIVALEARAAQSVERDRLARELHDSLGHALTVTTLQAAAARELLDSDVEFAREALRRIEETGRGAMEELDDVLGLLHEQGPGGTGAGAGAGAGGTGFAARRRLADLDGLVAETRAAGVQVSFKVTGPVAKLPPLVSREGYRIVQEGLTNAAKHAGGAAVTLRVAALDAGLEIDLVNAAGAETLSVAGGRGIAGMRERVRMLGGSMSAGHDGGLWRVSVRLPTSGIGGA